MNSDRSTSVGSSTTVARLPLRKNFAWTLIGNVVFAACQWGVLVTMAKLGTPEMIGQFSLGLAITAPITLFSMLQLRGAQATDSEGEYSFSDYLTLRLTTSILAMIVAVIVATCSGYSGHIVLLVILSAIAALPDMISDVIYGLWQNNERMDWISTSTIFKGLLTVSLTVLTLVMTKSLALAICSQCLGRLISLLVYDCPVTATILGLRCKGFVQPLTSILQLRTNPCARQQGELFRRCLPLGFVMMLLTVNASIPRYFMQYHHGERELGVFSAFLYLTTAGSVFVNALAQSAVPQLSRHFAAGKVTAFCFLVGKLMLITVVIGCAALTVAHFGGAYLLSVVYTGEYSDYSREFTWIVGATALSWVFSLLGVGLTATRQFNMQYPANIVIVAGTILFSALWIPEGSVLGAAQTLMASAILQGAAMAAIIGYVIVRQRVVRRSEKIEETESGSNEKDRAAA